MHDIEPYFNWRHIYLANEDPRSPFYGRFNSEVYFTDTIYNHWIHPQWDNIESETLFVKLLYTDYLEGYCVIELLGEWNDAITNDIMLLKTHLAEPLLAEGVNKFILIGENVLNFHGSDDLYYEEWFEDMEDEGWCVLLNFQPHVLEEMKRYSLDSYLIFSDELENISWRPRKPQHLYLLVREYLRRFLPL